MSDALRERLLLMSRGALLLPQRTAAHRPSWRLPNTTQT